MESLRVHVVLLTASESVPAFDAKMTREISLSSIFWKAFSILLIAGTLYSGYDVTFTEDPQYAPSLTEALGWLPVPIILVVVLFYAFDFRLGRTRPWLKLFANVYAGYVAFSITFVVLQSWDQLAENIVALVLFSSLVFVLWPLTAFLEWLAIRRYARGQTVRQA